MKDKVVLIGMPGCGKSTIGKVISNELKLKFYDMDEYIEDMTSKTIPQLFEMGETYFRDFETLACRELSKKDNILISSGGGVIKRKENMDILKEKSYIVFIDRPLEELLKDIDISGRPLLKEGRDKLIKLYDERYELYNLYADEIIRNDNELENVISIAKEVIKLNLELD
ncbi:Shikimate kinase [Clostridium sp. DL-VIII]|uniref:shikimate kinase n=1 Tax=Clostridium sp. DL-VIII TaxID=641107 RepID=UPI00023AF3E9|nr:shikimate kinase [Clostridium sp. DL-VIII]EHI97772.1 Shikimate kinase [Clostridium sp. DL-VIII]